jgi:hypothetical protein
MREPGSSATEAIAFFAFPIVVRRVARLVLASVIRGGTRSASGWLLPLLPFALAAVLLGLFRSRAQCATSERRSAQCSASAPLVLVCGAHVVCGAGDDSFGGAQGSCADNGVGWFLPHPAYGAIARSRIGMRAPLELEGEVYSNLPEVVLVTLDPPRRTARSRVRNPERDGRAALAVCRVRSGLVLAFPAPKAPNKFAWRQVRPKRWVRASRRSSLPDGAVWHFER